MEVICPPDKSLTHRALLFAGLAAGRSEIHNPLLGEDCLSTIGCLRALGVVVDIQPAKHLVIVDSPGVAHWQSPLVPLDFGNSGTTARLMTGILASLPGMFATGFGDASLSGRPMGRVIKPLQSIGASISGRSEGRYLPLAITGQKLRPGRHVVDKASAQVKSALLLAGLNIEGTTTVTLPVGGRDHTEQILKTLGADLKVAATPTEESISLNGPVTIPPGTWSIPGDPSSAAFLYVLGILRPNTKLTITNILNNKTRSGALEILRSQGAKLLVTASNSNQRTIEPTYDVEVETCSQLEPANVAPAQIPSCIDEIPILAVAGLFANGTSRYRGLEELRVKESDRLNMTMGLLRTVGGRAEIQGDDLIVHGPIDKVRGFDFDPHGDHRLAMAAGILAKLTDEKCIIRNPACADVSFPGFFPLIDRICNAHK